MRSGLFALGLEIVNLKAIVAWIASRFASAAHVGADVASEFIETEKTMEGTQTDTASAAGMSTGESAFANALAANTAVAGTSAAGVINAGAVPLFALNQQLNVNTAIKIALALKSIDTSLTVDQVQAGTNAALSALYAPAA